MGERARAELYYQKTLSQAPRDPQALYLLGSLYYELRKFDEAQKLLEKSLSIRSGYLPALAMLGVIASVLGDRKGAVQHFRAVVRVAPNDFDAQFNLAQALNGDGQFEEAVLIYQSILKAKPSDQAAVLGLTNALEALGQIDKAISEFDAFLNRHVQYPNAFLAFGALLLRRADEKRAAAVFERCLTQHPAHPETLLQLGSSRFREGRFVEAEVLFRRLVELVPKNVVALNHLTATLTYLDRLDEAENFGRLAYSLSPKDPETLVTFGLLLQELGQSEEAEVAFRQAVSIRPEFAEAWNNIGMSLHNQGRTEEALECFERCILLKPDFPAAYTNKAQSLMTLGRLSEGWAIYHRRFDQKIYGATRRAFTLPAWDGVVVPGLKLLVWTDQGVGDELIYSSMVPDLQKKGVDIVLECSERLVPLFRRSFDGVSVVPRRVPLDPAINALQPNRHISIAELGGVLRPHLQSFPVRSGHLRADDASVAALRAAYKARSGDKLLVGVSWKSENPRAGKSKSLDVEAFARILSGCPADFVSLQYGNDEADIKAFADAGISIYKDSSVNALIDMDKFAAQVASMDLVLTVSNTTAHVAGALNVPVWNLIPRGHGALWYWLMNGEYSPWYSSMRFFRQRQPKSWAIPISQSAQNLQHAVSAL